MTFEADVPRALFQTHLREWSRQYEYAYSGNDYAVSADGQRVLVNFASDPKPSTITAILNWTAGTEKVTTGSNY